MLSYKNVFMQIGAEGKYNIYQKNCSLQKPRTTTWLEPHSDHILIYRQTVPASSGKR